MTTILDTLAQWAAIRMRSLARQVHHWTRPLTRTLVGGALADVPKTRRTLIAENALLRQNSLCYGGRSNARPSHRVIGCSWCCSLD